MSKPALKIKLKLNTSLSIPRQPSQSTEAVRKSQGYHQPSAEAALPGDHVTSGRHAPSNGQPGPSTAGGTATTEKKTSFKIKVRQPPSLHFAAPSQPSGYKRPAEEQQTQAPKRIKLVTGSKRTGVVKGSAATPGAAALGPPRPKIRLKKTGAPLPPKQPRRAGDVAASGAGGFSIRDLIATRLPQPPPAELPSVAHPVVRLTLPPKVGAKKQKDPKIAGNKLSSLGSGPHQKGGPRKKHQQQILPEPEDLDDDSGPLLPRPPSTRHAVTAATVGVSEGPQPSGSKSVDEEVGMSLADEGDDIAFTEAPQALPSPWQAEPSDTTSAPALPILPSLQGGGPAAKKEDLERVLRLVQKKDHHNIFKEPVTEDVAPNYFKVIKDPMDFATIRVKMERGEYVTYEDLQSDLRLMFLNAMTYNPPDSPFYSHARTMLFSAEKLVEQARQGVLSQRQAAGEARKQNAQLRAQERAQRDALRAAARAEQKAAQEAKVLKKAGVGDHHEESLDESIRNSYRRPLRDLGQARWKGLGAGATAEGAALGWGRQVLRPSGAHTTAPGSYAASLLKFAASLSGKVRELTLARAAAATPQPDAAAAELLLKKQLARQPPAPTPLPSATAAPIATVTAAATPPPIAGAAVPAMPAAQPMLHPGMFNPMLLQQIQAQRPQQSAMPALPHTLSQQQQQQLAAMAAFKQQQLGVVATGASGQPRPPGQQLPGSMLAPMQQQALLMQQHALLAQQRPQLQQQQQQQQQGSAVRLSQPIGMTAAMPVRAPVAGGQQILQGVPGSLPGMTGAVSSAALVWPAQQAAQQQLLRPSIPHGTVPAGPAFTPQGPVPAGVSPQPQQHAQQQMQGQPQGAAGVPTTPIGQQLHQQQQQAVRRGG